MKNVKDMGDEEVMHWALAKIESLDYALSWAGWGFSYSDIPKVTADHARRVQTQREAVVEARKRGLFH